MSASEPIPLRLAFFEPSAERARLLDARMRHRLGESVRHVAEQSRGQLTIPEHELDDFFAKLAAGPVSPHAFGAYFDLVLAIERGACEEAEQRLAELVAAPVPAPGIRVVELGAALGSLESDRYRRQVDSDPSAPLEIVPPPPAAAAACRGRVDAAFALLASGDGALAQELPALLREIVLAASKRGPNMLDFDGASSFQLWGALVLNAEGHATVLEMVQALAHESGHGLLFGLSADGPLVENDDLERFASPLRRDPRPIDGIFHATWVTARMHQAVSRLLATGVLTRQQEDEARAACENHVKQFAQGLATLDRHARLTAMGAAVLSGARTYMAGAAREITHA
jgi:HEXXH motif-containing protein